MLHDLEVVREEQVGEPLGLLEILQRFTISAWIETSSALIGSWHTTNFGRHARAFEIVYPVSAAEIPLDEYQAVLVETDADAQFDKENRIAVRSEPSVLEVIGKASLRGGRVRWRMKCNAATVVGAAGKIIVTLTKPDGIQLTDEVGFVVTKPATEKSKQTKAKVPPFDIVGINPTDGFAQWGANLAGSR